MSMTTKMTKQGIRDLDFGVARPKPAVAQAPVADASPLPAEGASIEIPEGTIPAATEGGAS